MSNFQSDDYPWKPNFSNLIKFKLKTSNHKLHLKAFQKIFVWSSWVTSFFCRCLTNLTLLVLQGPIFNELSTRWSQTLLITTNWKKKINKSEHLSENLNLKLLCDAIFLFAARPIRRLFYNGQFSIRWVTVEAILLKWREIENCFTEARFCLDDYHW